MATLPTVPVEHTYSKLTSNSTFAVADIEKFVELAQGLSPYFYIVYHGSISLVALCYESHEQIVLPSSSGFWTLAIKECYRASLAWRLSTQKTLALLHSCVWW